MLPFVGLMPTRFMHTTATMIDQDQFYNQLTRTLTPLAFRESIEKGRGSADGDISTWVRLSRTAVAVLRPLLLFLFHFESEHSEAPTRQSQRCPGCSGLRLEDC